MSGFAQLERQALCDLLATVGPDAPTLCEGWRTADLAAHLVVRERRPDAAAGVVVPALSGRTERVQRQIRDRGSWTDLLRTVRDGPPLLLRPLDEVVNTVEFFVHHEDVRRASSAAEPRALDPALERVLWRRLGMLSRMVLRRAPVGVVLHAPGVGRLVARKGEPAVTITGSPDELVLWTSGRRSAAAVEVDGPPDSVAALTQTRFGL